MSMAWSVSTRFRISRAVSTTDTGIRATTQLRVANVSIFMGTIAGIVMLIGLLLSFDLFLAHLDQRESAARASAEYEIGVSTLHAGRPSDAADHFGTAVSIDRSNVNYALALGEAMLQEGRTADAEATLRALLARAENDGAVNLTMAHVMLREGRTEDTKAYLHRAIFGRWGADSVERRNQARFELIDLLAARGTPRSYWPSCCLSRTCRLTALRCAAGWANCSFSPGRPRAARRCFAKCSSAIRPTAKHTRASPKRRSRRAICEPRARTWPKRCNCAPATRKRWAASGWWTRCLPSTLQHGASTPASGYRGVTRCSRGRSLWWRRAPVLPRQRWIRRERCCHRRSGVPFSSARIQTPMPIV